MQLGGNEKMTMQFVTDYINKKLNENPNYIRYTSVSYTHLSQEYI